jgi:hypothetical protein
LRGFFAAQARRAAGKTKNKKQEGSKEQQKAGPSRADGRTRTQTPAGFEKQACHNQQPDPNDPADCCAVVGCGRSQ